MEKIRGKLQWEFADEKISRKEIEMEKITSQIKGGR